MARGMAKRDRSTVGGSQSGSGVGGDDRDRQGQKIQDPESPWATGQRSEQAEEKGSIRRGSGLGSSAKSRPGSKLDTGARTGRGEDRLGRTRSGSRSKKK